MSASASSGESSSSTSLPTYFPPPTLDASTTPVPRLTGAHDLIGHFDLLPLYDSAVRPYMHRSRGAARRAAAAAAAAATVGAGGGGEVGGWEKRKAKEEEERRVQGFVKREGGEDGAQATTSGAGGGEDKPRLLPKTYVHYVDDLPGRVKPPKRPLPKPSRENAAPRHGGGGEEEEDDAAGAATGNQTYDGWTSMRDIVYKPETTLQLIAPFEDDVLAGSFRVEPGVVEEIDASLLEPADETETPRKKKKKVKRKSKGGPGAGAGAGGVGGA